MPKHLSQVLENYDLKKDRNKICIVAGVGSGKNHWVEHILSRNKSVLLITSRRAVTDQTEKHDNPFSRKKSHPGFAHHYTTETYSQLEIDIKDSPSINYFDDPLIRFDYIVVDEAHALLCDSTFTDSAFYVWAYINQASRESTVILMTATVSPIIKKLENEGWKILDFTKQCINIKPKQIEIITRNEAVRLLRQTTSSNKALYMGTNAKYLAGAFFNELTRKTLLPENIAVTMSDETQKLNLEAKELKKSDVCYKSIIDESKLPDGINILLTTSKLKEGVNIIDANVKMIFIESHYAVDIIQFLGRVRLGVETAYIIDDADQNFNSYQEVDYDYSQITEIPAANEYLKMLIIEHDSNWGKIPDRNYYKDSKTIKEFVDYIENRFDFIRYNPFKQVFELYSQRYSGFQQHEYYIKNYKGNEVESIRAITGINNVTDPYSICRTHRS